MLKRFFVGLMFIFSASAVQAVPMTFSVEGNGGTCKYGCQWIKAGGEITKSTPADYQEFINKLDFVPISVQINGFGKDVIAATELGKLFRKHNQSVYVADSLPATGDNDLDEIVRGSCYATCVYALLGGVSYGIKDPASPHGHENSIIVLEDIEELLTYNSINVEKLGLNVSTVDLTKGILRNYLDEMETHPELTKQILNIKGYLTIRMDNAEQYHLQNHRTKFPFEF